MVSGGLVVRSSVISYNSDNGVIRSQPSPCLIVFPQLSGYLDPEFFMTK